MFVRYDMRYTQPKAQSLSSLVIVIVCITIQLVITFECNYDRVCDHYPTFIVIERIKIGSAIVIEPAILFDSAMYYLTCVCDRLGDRDHDCNRNRVCDQFPNAILIESAITIQIVILMSDDMIDTYYLYNPLAISSKRFKRLSS